MSVYALTKEQYQELYKQVLLFSKIGGVVADEDVLWKMCEEEYVEELSVAVMNKNSIGIVDAIADSFVVLTQLHHYYASKPSWEFRELFYDPYWSNSVSSIKSKNTNFAFMCMTLWSKEAEVFSTEYNFNLYKAIKEVNRSNMTKFPTVRELLKRGNGKVNVKDWADECEALSNGKYKDVKATIEHYSKTQNDFHGEEVVVFRADGGKGKIIKHLGFFQEPNFEECWV